MSVFLSQGPPARFPASFPRQKRAAVKLCREDAGDSCKRPTGRGGTGSWAGAGGGESKGFLSSARCFEVPLRHLCQRTLHLGDTSYTLEPNTGSTFQGGRQVTASNTGGTREAHQLSIPPARNPHTDLQVPDNPQGFSAAARSLPGPRGTHAMGGRPQGAELCRRRGAGRARPNLRAQLPLTQTQQGQSPTPSQEASPSPGGPSFEPFCLQGGLIALTGPFLYLIILTINITVLE